MADKLVIDCGGDLQEDQADEVLAPREVVIREESFTDAEREERAKIDADAQAQAAALENAAAKRQADQDAARAKLRDLGLTDDEIDALVFVGSGANV